MTHLTIMFVTAGSANVIISWKKLKQHILRWFKILVGLLIQRITATRTKITLHSGILTPPSGTKGLHHLLPMVQIGTHRLKAAVLHRVSGRTLEIIYKTDPFRFTTHTIHHLKLTLVLGFIYYTVINRICKPQLMADHLNLPWFTWKLFSSAQK